MQRIQLVTDFLRRCFLSDTLRRKTLAMQSLRSVFFAVVLSPVLAAGVVQAQPNGGAPAPDSVPAPAPDSVPAPAPEKTKKKKKNKVPSDKSLMAPGEKELMGTHKAKLGATKWRPGKGLHVESEDGKFSIVTRVRLQPRVTVTNASGSEASMGMILRRARLQFIGNTFGKHNKYKAEFAFSPRDLRVTDDGLNKIPRETPLLTWYLEFDHLKNATVRLGQYKIPYSRQRVISSGNLQLVDRALANGEFNLDRDIGIDIRSKDLFGLGKFKYYVGVYNGEGRSAFTEGTRDLMYLARFEYLPFGLFKDYSEGDFQRLSKPGLSIGVAYAYAKNAVGTRVNRRGGPADGGTTDFNLGNLDATFKYKGLAISGELHWRDGTRNPGNAVDEMGNPIPEEAARNGIGYFAQAGYLLPRKKIEIAGRFGQLFGADDSSLSDRNEAGVALSYYMAQHPFKLQADAFQEWNPNDSFSDGVTRVRVQLQLAF